MKTVCLVGLPQAGKTTFLAALWEVVFHDETDGAIRLAEMPAQREYLTEIHKTWVRCDPTVRTRDYGAVTDIHAVHSVDLALVTADGSRVQLGVPDIAGEAFNEVWEEGVWEPGIRSRARAATSVILFVHPGNVDYPVPVEKLRQVAWRLEEGHEHLEEEVGEDAPRWKPQLAPTQVKLVQLLQSLFSLDSEREVLSTAVVISAWDEAEADGLEPSEWIEVHLPLLWQFFASAPERFPHRVFGVSAQGGDYSSDEDVQRLREIEPPSQRVRVRDDEHTHRDITAPVRWFLNLQ